MNERESKPDQAQGLYRKYEVNRINDPAGKHADCTYYVLDLDHDPHSVAALEAYAESCKEQYPTLAFDLRHTAAATARKLGVTPRSSTPTNDMQLWQGPWNDGPAPYYKIPCADYHRLQQKIKDEEKLRESWREQASIWQQRSTPSAIVPKSFAERCRPAVAHYMRTNERSAMSTALSPTGVQAAKAQAEKLGALLDEIDASFGGGT